MTHKYERKCWSCGSTDIEKDDHGVVCRKCGATWNYVPLLGGPTRLDEEFHDFVMSIREVPISGSPSRGVVNQAARARGDIPPKKRPER